MELIKKINDHIEEAEDFRSKKYPCDKGYITIGFGRAETKGLTKDESIYLGTGFQGLDNISIEDARYLLTNDILEISNVLSDKIDFFRYAPDHVKFVLTDMAFNMGVTGLHKFPKMLRHMKACNYSRAAQELLDSDYLLDVKGRAVKLHDVLITGSMDIDLQTCRDKFEVMEKRFSKLIEDKIQKAYEKEMAKNKQ